MRQKCNELLGKFASDGKKFLNQVRTILDRELQWLHWKIHDKCASFEKAAVELSNDSISKFVKSEITAAPIMGHKDLKNMFMEHHIPAGEYLNKPRNMKIPTTEEHGERSRTLNETDEDAKSLKERTAEHLVCDM